MEKEETVNDKILALLSKKDAWQFISKSPLGQQIAIAGEAGKIMTEDIDNGKKRDEVFYTNAIFATRVALRSVLEKNEGFVIMAKPMMPAIMIDFPNTITVALSEEDAKDYIHALEANGQSDCFALKVDHLENYFHEKIMKDGYHFLCVIYEGSYVVFTRYDFFAVYGMQEYEIEEELDMYSSTSAVEAYVQTVKMSKTNKDFDKEDLEKKRINAMLHLAISGLCVAVESSKGKEDDPIRDYDLEWLVKNVSTVKTEIGGEKVDAFPVYTSAYVVFRTCEEEEYRFIHDLPLELDYMKLIPQSYIVINPKTADFVISKESLKLQIEEAQNMSNIDKYNILGFVPEPEEDWPSKF